MFSSPQGFRVPLFLIRRKTLAVWPTRGRLEAARQKSQGFEVLRPPSVSYGPDRKNRLFPDFVASLEVQTARAAPGRCGLAPSGPPPVRPRSGREGTFSCDKFSRDQKKPLDRRGARYILLCGKPIHNVESTMSSTSVAVVLKALAILEHLGGVGDAGVSQLSRDLRLPVATVHRLLATLCSAGYVLQNLPTQEYRLSTKVLQLSGSVLSRLNVRAVALPHMQRIAASSRETMNLGVLEDTRIVYAETIPSPEPLRFEIPLGGILAPHCTGLGKAICSHIARAELSRILPRGRLPRFTPRTITDRATLFREFEEARARGYALDDEERHRGIRSLGAPIWDRQGKVVAAVSLVAPTLRMPDDRLAEVASVVLKTAAEISTELGFCLART